MNFIEAIRSGFSNYTNFSGRAPRSEYWNWVLFAFLVGVTAGVLDVFFFGVRDPHQSGPVGEISSLLLLIPGIAVSVRRLHDVDRSGWWMLIALTGIGLIPLIYWYCKEGDKSINSFGPPPEISAAKRRAL